MLRHFTTVSKSTGKRSPHFRRRQNSVNVAQRRTGRIAILETLANPFAFLLAGIYRTLERFLGLDGNLSSGYDVPSRFVDIWNTMLTTNDFLNPNTGEFDPRHMYGTANQDVFRWPAIKDGTDRQLLGSYVTTLLMPGIPLLLWGEEQAFYVLDNTADNYVFGRQAMSAASAWQLHGCYTLGASQYYDWPVESATTGCHDNSVSLDHRDPTHPVRNIVKGMYAQRQNFPVLNDGLALLSLSNQTHEVQFPGSNGTATEMGLWSIVRTHLSPIQEQSDFETSVWLVYQNEGKQVDYTFDCTSDTNGLLAPYAGGTTVKNLLAPYEELRLQKGPGKKFFVDGSQVSRVSRKRFPEPFRSSSCQRGVARRKTLCNL